MGKMIQNYSLQNEIGKGAYSTVYRAINVKTKQEVAIKQVRAEKFRQLPKLEEGTYNEINILTTLGPSPHIIRYLDMLKTANNFYFVYEFCNGGTLQKVLKERGVLPQRQALDYFQQILDAFKILNKHSIMHRDLKPQNLLLHDGVVKLADFGFCKPLEHEDEISKTMIGSPIYMAPEILKGQTYSITADIWSLGVVLFRMIYGFCPFQSGNIAKLIQAIQNQDLKIPEKPYVSSQVIQLIKRMVTKDPKQRADWNQVFSYDVQNGQLKQTGYSKQRGLKKSFTISEASTSINTQSGISIQQLTSSKNLRTTMQNVQGSNQNPGSQLIYSPRPNSQLRNTYTGRTSIQINMKRNILIKNHQKCIQVMSLAIGLSAQDQPQALALAYLLLRNIDRELNITLESVRKQMQLQNEETLMKSFAMTLQNQLAQLKNLLLNCRDSLRSEIKMPLQNIQTQKRELLRKYVSQLSKDRLEELVLGSRVADYILEEILIRRETYEKMSGQRLLATLINKTEAFS